MRKPSAALVVASLALVMATIGTSVAATGYTITSSKQIKPGSVSLELAQQGARARPCTARAARRARRARPATTDTTARTGMTAPTADGEDADKAVGADQGGRHRQRLERRRQRAQRLRGHLLRQLRRRASASAPPRRPRPRSPIAARTTGIPGPAFVAISGAAGDLAPGFPRASSVTVETRRTNGTQASTSFVIAVFC